jgi:hypothetical protein
MFHDIYVCLFINPDLDGHQAPKNGSLTLRDPENCKVPKPKYEANALHSHPSIGYPICFTICLFISPDLDGHRAPKNGPNSTNGQRYFI